MTSIKLFYFDFKGRAECIRLLLSAAEKEFEDVRFAREDWPEYKKLARFGQAPYVVIDGETFGQTLAILQHFAREYGFYGQSNIEALKVDQVLQLVHELTPYGAKILHEQDEVKKSEYETEVRDKVSKRLFGYFEDMLAKSQTGYLVGNKLSVADIAVYDMCNCALKTHLAPISDYKLLEALLDKVAQNPGIKKFLESRPDSAM